MEFIVFDINNELINLNLNKNIILFGQNSIYKNNLINNIKDGLTGKSKNILINGKKPDLKDYNIVYIDEDTDFEDEFKFTKNNIFKQMIYNDIIDNINSEKLIDYTNEIFDVIDRRVNNLLDKNINKKIDNNVSFEIEVPDVNSIIDKFTNIYIDDFLLNSSEISKSTKRKLLYQINFWNIENNRDKCNIVIINSFDAYFNSNDLIFILNCINKLCNNNYHFILSTSNNIFEYISLDYFSVYKVTNKVIPFVIINDAIKTYLIKKEFCNEDNMSFTDYFEENKNLLLPNEIDLIKNTIIDKFSYQIGKILNCNELKIVKSKPKNISYDDLIADDNTAILFYEIYQKFID